MITTTFKLKTAPLQTTFVLKNAIVCDPVATGDAVAADVLAGKTFSNAVALDLTGTRPPCPVPKTGQVNSYFAGDDGDLQTGVAWPDPRFTDNSDGTVTDNLTGLMWIKNISGVLRATWTAQIGFCRSLSFAGYSDWRLPNLKEYSSLQCSQNYGPALPTDHPFIVTGKTTESFHCSDTEKYAPNRAYYWFAGNGGGSGGSKDNLLSAWPVRGPIAL